ncbi:MAG: hypothetical protein EAX95_11885 [Candidatus Thorarchaeota archaeon]|nr:hypothetical protein [Candidatus Thorarchaeota archaeon]
MSPQSELPLPSAHSDIPLFSGAFYEGYYIGGIVWGFALRIVLYIMHIAIDLFQWLLITMAAGLFIHLLAVGLKRRRFRNPVTNQALVTLFEDVRRDLGKGGGIELWYRDIDRAVFLSTANFLFSAILLSESTIADILEKGDKGKILLAREVMLIERRNPASQVAIALLAFTFTSFFEVLSFGGAWGQLSFSLIPLVLTFGTIAVLIAIASIPYILTGSTNRIDQKLEDLYGFPPVAAGIEVLSGFRISDQMVQDTKSEKETAPNRRMHALKIGVAGAVIASFVAFVIMSFLFSEHHLFLTFALVVSAVVGVGAFAIIFAISSMWFLFKPHGPRNTEYDIQVPFAADVQGFLYSFLDDERTAVVATKWPFDDEYGLVITRLVGNYEEKALFAIMPNVLKDIKDVELAGPLVLSEIWRKNIERRYNRVSYVFVGSGLIFVFSAIILLAINLGFGGLSSAILSVLAIYLIVTIIPGAIASIWKRNAEIKSDVRVAKSCPRFVEVLQVLVDKHHTLPYGTTSYKTRLERIAKYLEPADQHRNTEPS